MLSAECHHLILIQVSEFPVPMRPSCASATVLAIFEMETVLMCFPKEHRFKRRNLRDHRCTTRFTNAFRPFSASDERSSWKRISELKATNELVTATITQLAARSALLLGSGRIDDVLRLRIAVHRPFSVSLPVHCTRGRGLTFTLARVLVSSTYQWARLATHRPQGTHNTSCAARALVPTLAAQPPHVCHRQGDWAVSVGSHMQQDIDISNAPLLGAPIALFDYRSRQKTTIQKIGANFSPDIVVIYKCCTA